RCPKAIQAPAPPDGFQQSSRNPFRGHSQRATRGGNARRSALERGAGKRPSRFEVTGNTLASPCQGNCSLRCGRQNGHAPSTSNRPPTTMNTRVTEKPATKCGRVKGLPSKNNPYT